MLQAPTPRLILAPLLLVTGLCACATPTVTAQSANCSGLLPADWKLGIPPAPLPEGETVADWIIFGDQQTGRLDQANGRTRDAIGIVERCESRDAEALKRARRGWLSRLFS